MRRFVLATGNTGKLSEMRALLADLRIEVIRQSDLGILEAEETGLTFIENALIKARNACRHSGLPALADDSGLEVDALDGAPGIHSARFAGPGASDDDNNRRLLRALEKTPAGERTARFHCVLALMRNWSDPTPEIFCGVWSGQILPVARGSGGFGYDPLFLPEGSELSSAELPADEKNRLSHRGQALAALRSRLSS